MGSRRRRKPEWVRELEEDAAHDEDIAKVVRGTEGDPDKIRANMRQALQGPEVFRPREGSDVPPRITFRTIDPFSLWVWIEFVNPPLSDERDMLEALLRSWYIVGKFGGYNSQNLQMHYAAEDDASFFDYDNDGADGSMDALVHEMGELEFKDNWARVRFDMGTTDEIATDIMLNMLRGFSRDMCGLASVCVGGANEDWPAPREADDLLEGEDERMGGFSAAAAGRGGDGDGDGEEEFGDDIDYGGGRREGYAKVGMNPMKLPTGIEEELDWLAEEGFIGEGPDRRSSAASGPQSPGGSWDSNNDDETGDGSSMVNDPAFMEALKSRLGRKTPSGSSNGAGINGSSGRAWGESLAQRAPGRGGRGPGPQQPSGNGGGGQR